MTKSQIRAPRLWHPTRKKPFQITHFFGQGVSKGKTEEVIYIGQYLHESIWFCTSLHPSQRTTFEEIAKKSARLIVRLPVSILSYNTQDTLLQDGNGAVWARFAGSPFGQTKLVQLIKSSKEWHRLIYHRR